MFLVVEKEVVGCVFRKTKQGHQEVDGMSITNNTILILVPDVFLGQNVFHRMFPLLILTYHVRGYCQGLIFKYFKD